jgi:Flp pilus assembly protein protease CpaA
LSASALEVLSWAKVALVLSVLAGASISDVRSRRVPDRFWIVLISAGSVILVLEILLMEVRRPGLTLLSLAMPALALVFMVWGYPELDKALKGEREDLAFTLVYLGLIGAAVVSYLLGDRSVGGRMLVSFIFMAVYFAMYSFPVLGARLIHGGADVKCLMSLAAIFPWYPADLGISFGPFHEALSDIDLLAYISPVHLGVLINGALVTVILLGVALPIRNLVDGTFHPLRSWTSYWLGIDRVLGSHVWIIGGYEMGKDRKIDPSPRIVSDLRKKGVQKVRVTPKVPFILSLTVGLALQITLGNLVLALMFLFG